ncbi:MAG TPA: protein kinase [Kofleriaceae bacterium]|nr:protein kinase [Kofleriaceae bacterium]
MGDTVGGRYRLDGRLGEGGMGQVYRARHLQLGKAFALKLISPAFALDTAARARFNEEAKLASEISHPNLVSVVDFGEDDAFGAYMVMELVEGDPLVNEVRTPMAPKRACDILGQIADALDHIHRRGIVHGDVKADNIMLTDETTGARRRRIARLLDFGLARRHDASEQDHVNGSPHYLAPECAAGGPPSVAADIYALGVLAYMLVTATLPFDGNVVEILMAHINAQIEPPSRRRGEPIDEAFEALILRALAKDPAHRHTSASAFRYELNNVMDMLELGRRRRAVGTDKVETRDANLVAVFDASRIAQAVLSLGGTIVHANKAFARLVGQETVDGEKIDKTILGNVLPGLSRAIRAVHGSGKPQERRARVFRGHDVPDLELVVWISALAIPNSEILLMIKVEEAAT